MFIEDLQPLQGYCKLSDDRGVFDGIVNHGNWQEVNVVHSHASVVRGGHYHRQTTEVIFILQGKATVQLAPYDHLQQKSIITLAAGQGVEIPPLTVHTFHYLEDSIHLQLLDLRFDPTHQDLFSIDQNHDTRTDDSTDSTLD